MRMLEDIDMEIGSIRLDRYYSFPSYVDRFGEAKVYVIPRKNSTLRGSWKWKRTMMEFVEDTIPYLEQCYLRNHSESHEKDGLAGKWSREGRIGLILLYLV